MEPRRTAPANEGMPQQVAGGETLPQAPELGGVQSPESNPERTPGVSVAQASAAVAQAADPVLPVPVVQPTTPDPAALLANDNIPSVAGDDDLIEKEWVDKAKKIITDTRDDPYRREREVSKLQIEYIRKRYGREIGDAGDR